MVAAAVIGAGVASAAATTYSGSLQAGASKSAAAQQAAAEKAAQEQTAQYYADAQGNLQPFISTGQGANNQLAALSGSNPGGNPLTSFLTEPFANSGQSSAQALAATPGYQFSLGQGLQATQNSLAAQGLGGSGNALAGAASYAEGLASTTYQQQFQDYQASQQQAYNVLSGLSSTGAQAAANLGQIGTGASQLNANEASQLGAAQASGTLGAANAQAGAITGAVGGLGSSAINSAVLSRLLASPAAGTGVNAITPQANGTAMYYPS